VQCVSSFAYLLGQLQVIFEPFCPVDTVLLFTVLLYRICFAFSALTLFVGRQEGCAACKKLEWWGTGMVICLERGADLHIVQLMATATHCLLLQ